MPEYAMTFTPESYEDQTTGQTVYDFENTPVISAQPKLAAAAQEYQEQLDGYRENEQGELENYRPITDSDTEHIFEMFGGETNYNNALRWAAENFSEEEIEAYDSAMSEGDFATSVELARSLMERYEADGGNEKVSLADFQEYFFREVTSPEGYEVIKQYMNDFFEPEEVAVVNQLLDNGQYPEYLNIINGVIRELQK